MNTKRYTVTHLPCRSIDRATGSTCKVVAVATLVVEAYRVCGVRQQFQEGMLIQWVYTVQRRDA